MAFWKCVVAIAVVITTLLPLQSLAACGWVTFYHATGNKTACGDPYTGEEMYAAHRSLPCGTKLRVTDKATGKSVNVTVRDRGPAKWTGNDLDLSFRAARMIGMVHRGRIRGCWG